MYIPKSFPTPSLNTLGSFVFELCCGQTDRQTDGLELPIRTPTDIRKRCTVVRNTMEQEKFGVRSVNWQEASLALCHIFEPPTKKQHVNSSLAVFSPYYYYYYYYYYYCHYYASNKHEQ